MNAAETKAVCKVAFETRWFATFFEEAIGAKMLKDELKAGHVGKIPTFPKAGLGSDKPDADHWLKKAKELVKVLKGQPPMGREQLAIIMKCSKETMARRASFAVKQGMIVKLDSKSWKAGVPTITYAIGKGETT
jgi:predicted HTH transcriptional regulator